MTASYARADKTCDKVGWFTMPSVTNLCIHKGPTPAYVSPVESSVLAQSGKYKRWSSESEPSFQTPPHLPTGAEVNNQMVDVCVEELSRFKCLLWII